MRKVNSRMKKPAVVNTVRKASKMKCSQKLTIRGSLVVLEKKSYNRPERKNTNLK